MSGDDFVLEVNGRPGIPLGLAGYLIRAIGAAYPHTKIKTGGDGHRGMFGSVTMRLLIPGEDLYAAETDGITDEDLAALGGEKDIAELTAFIAGWRDGALGLVQPAWLSTLLQLTAEQMVDAMPPKAENYVSIEINRPGGGEPFTWIVCRPGRPSPHDLRKKAEEERAQLRADLDAALDRLQVLEGAEEWERIPSCDTQECDTCRSPKGTCCQHCPYVHGGHPVRAGAGTAAGERHPCTPGALGQCVDQGHDHRTEPQA